MDKSNPAQQRRKFDREPRRITCEIKALGERFKGVVRDLSARGLFVQTNAAPPEGTRLHIRLYDADAPPMDLVASVARRRASHRSLAALEAKGLGVRILSAPEEYFRLVMSLTE